MTAFDDAYCSFCGQPHEGACPYETDEAKAHYHAMVAAYGEMSRAWEACIDRAVRTATVLQMPELREGVRVRNEHGDLGTCTGRFDQAVDGHGLQARAHVLFGMPLVTYDKYPNCKIIARPKELTILTEEG